MTFRKHRKAQMSPMASLFPRLQFSAFMLVCVCLAAPGARAQPAPAPVLPAVPCIDEAAAFHGVNSLVLRAIIIHESRGNPTLVMRNKNGSIDVGFGGINSVHFDELRRYGVQPEHLLNGCVNTYVTAWHLAKQVKSYGNTWAAVGSYHSRTPEYRERYAGLIYAVLKRWGALP
jgi:soluble lytic murein transglycosylase-like protein